MSEHDLLAGVTVINLAINLPGPYAAARLSSLGARVIKVEPPDGRPGRPRRPRVLPGADLRSRDPHAQPQR